MVLYTAGTRSFSYLFMNMNTNIQGWINTLTASIHSLHVLINPEMTPALSEIKAITNKLFEYPLMLWVWWQHVWTQFCTTIQGLINMLSTAYPTCDRPSWPNTPILLRNISKFNNSCKITILGYKAQRIGGPQSFYETHSGKKPLHPRYWTVEQQLDSFPMGRDPFWSY